ncbi:MAG: transposase [Solirubrobacteraceae bacterium]
MDSSKVPPRTAAVDQLQQILDSPEVARLVKTLEYVRWTGRPGYPVRAMVGMCLVKSLYALPTWSRTVRLAAEHPGIQAILGCTPSQWACYRFARQLRERDDWALTQCLQDVLAGLRERFPTLGRDIAIDGSDLPAYANGHMPEEGEVHKPSDPTASWGHRSAVSTRAKGGFYGYKLHAAVDIGTDLPLAWTVATAKDFEAHHAIPLIDRLKAQGFTPQVAVMDKGYDGGPVHAWCMNRGVAPIIPLKETGPVKRGAGEPPHCAHGEWTFAGADYKRQATKWRCPTGECQPGSMWRKASRLHPLIPRETKRYTDLYRKRGAVERQFGRLKHEWALLPLRVRGIGQVQLHADLTILACLASRLAAERTALPLAA